MAAANDIMDLQPFPSFPWSPSLTWWIGCGLLLIGFLWALRRSRTKNQKNSYATLLLDLRRELAAVIDELPRSSSTRTLLARAAGRIRATMEYCLGTPVTAEKLHQFRMENGGTEHDAVFPEAARKILCYLATTIYDLERVRFAARIDADDATQKLQQLNQVLESAHDTLSTVSIPLRAAPHEEIPSGRSL